MGANADLLCLCALYVLIHFINPETLLESGNYPDMLSPTRLPQVCAMYAQDGWKPSYTFHSCPSAREE